MVKPPPQIIAKEIDFKESHPRSSSTSPMFNTRALMTWNPHIMEVWFRQLGITRLVMGWF